MEASTGHDKFLLFIYLFIFITEFTTEFIAVKHFTLYLYFEIYVIMHLLKISRM